MRYHKLAESSVTCMLCTLCSCALHAAPQERCGVQQQFVGAYLQGELPPSAIIQDASQQAFLQQAQHTITEEHQVSMLRH